MNAAELLERARGLGATFTVTEPSRVHVSAPEPLPDELMSALRELKPQVLDLLTHVPDYSITACVCDQPIGGTGPERCEVCRQPLLCPGCEGCRGCKLAVRFGWYGGEKC